jgi:DNA-binding NarL/FixJ family response regulator
MKPVFRVLIVDDHAHAREAIRSILSVDAIFEVIGEARDSEEAIRMTEQYMPDMILMDIQLPGIDGLETTRVIKSSYPYVKIVMVTVSDDIAHLFDAIKKGAQGYLLKNLNPSAWIEYLRAICYDETPMSKELAARLLKEFTPISEAGTVHSPLTGREQEILTWVAKGKSNRDIAAALYISENTVKNHLKNILQKLHLENRVQLTRYAFEKGFIK